MKLKLGFLRSKAIRLVLCAGAAGMALATNAHLPAQSAPPAQSSVLTVSGYIEADEVSIASETGGRITALPFDEGVEVQAGAALVQLDRSLGEAQLRVAQAKVQSAEAALAKLTAGARPEAIRQAEAAVQVAEAQRDAAHQAWQDARTLLANQQSLDLQITQAKTQVEVTRQNVGAAVANQGTAQIYMDRYTDTIPFQTYSHWRAWIDVNTAGASYDGAQAILSSLEQQRRTSLEPRARVNAAESAYQAAEAAVVQAKANLADLRAGATAEQIAAAQAQVRVVAAGVQAIEAQLKKLTLYAPVGGIVTARSLSVGELATPGASILTLADLEHVSLVVYVPADKLGLVQLGRHVPVRVDGFPDRTFEGEIVHIADSAEFVPDNVQSAEDRATLVFAVKLRLSNADHALKPGVPADAQLGAQSSGE